MTITVDEASATITPSWGDGAQPALTPTPAKIFMHMRKGFKLGADLDNPEVEPAWKVKGRVKVSVGPGDTLKDWKFGFLQVVKWTKWSMRYSGRTRKDGSTILRPGEFLIPDGFARYHLDCGVAENPFASVPVTGDAIKPPILECEFGDHPTMNFAWKWPNKRWDSDNLFYVGSYGVDFLTILSLLDPTRSTDPDWHWYHLAHFKWSISYDLTVSQWRPLPPFGWDFPTISAFNADITRQPTIVKGPPTDPIFKDVTIGGRDSVAGVELRAAVKKLNAAGPGTGEAIKYQNDFFADLPHLFYKP
jgi:hypothetical protein